ncbi:coiled-coil domain-containing protein 74B [Platysternon megacephalum]|uniref:Coiled-coil domain-containing protein 74B n=1 Tax=Platysternon megacephalum TaxID=55544 RepID=A0A4D9F432_9SAUR|nr:coiled-coil domain-containing protein 74B [Platysternon megacephalum]
MNITDGCRLTVTKIGKLRTSGGEVNYVIQQNLFYTTFHAPDLQDNLILQLALALFKVAFPGNCCDKSINLLCLRGKRKPIFFRQRKHWNQSKLYIPKNRGQQ